jgi:hypothetical protein
MKFTATVEGAANLNRKLNNTGWFKDPVRELIDDARKAGEKHAKRRAPNKSGRTKSGIRSQMLGGSEPSAKISVDVTNPRDGFRYGWALNASAKTHYRSSGRRGAKTQKWFTGVRGLLRSDMRRMGKTAEGKIAKAWRA